MAETGRGWRHLEDLLCDGEVTWLGGPFSKMPDALVKDGRVVFHPCGRSISRRLIAKGRGRVDRSIEELQAIDKLRAGRRDAVRSIGQLRAGR